MRRSPLIQHARPIRVIAWDMPEFPTEEDCGGEILSGDIHFDTEDREAFICLCDHPDSASDWGDRKRSYELSDDQAYAVLEELKRMGLTP